MNIFFFLNDIKTPEDSLNKKYLFFKILKSNNTWLKQPDIFMVFYCMYFREDFSVFKTTIGEKF